MNSFGYVCVRLHVCVYILHVCVYMYTSHDMRMCVNWKVGRLSAAVAKRGSCGEMYLCTSTCAGKGHTNVVCMYVWIRCIYIYMVVEIGELAPDREVRGELVRADL